MAAGEEPSPGAGQGQMWAAGEAYEPYVGRWSRLVAVEFLKGLGVPAGGRWLDVGCGTGALSGAILDRCAPASVIGVDPSEGFLVYARRRVADPRAEFRQGDAQALPVGDAAVDVVVSGLVLNFVPEPVVAVREMARVVRPGGLVAAYVWDYAGRMELMRAFWDAAAAVHPDATDLDEGRRFPLCRPAPLTALFTDAGLDHVRAHPIEIPTRFRDFDDYWTPFLGGQGPAPAYAMSLGEDHRAALREALRARLPLAADGSIEMVARAWAVRGDRA